VSAVELPELPAPSLLHERSALFLDFDGTLVSIAPRPQDVHVAPWVVPTLQRVQHVLGGALALLSGRPLEQLDALLKPLQLAAAGVHGVERRATDGRRWAHHVELPPAIAKAVHALAQHHPELLIEKKPSSLAVHYRAAPELEPICRTTLVAALQGQTEWVLLVGHAVFEIKPRGLNKASALRAFLAEPPFTGRVPIVVGDDVTDEDAFAAALEVGGHGIKVGPGTTIARSRLGDPSAVCRWLTASADALTAMQT
jgi:trehalose 6-phosphate phosphatase